MKPDSIAFVIRFALSVVLVIMVIREAGGWTAMAIGLAICATELQSCVYQTLRDRVKRLERCLAEDL